MLLRENFSKEILWEKKFFSRDIFDRKENKRNFLSFIGIPEMSFMHLTTICERKLHIYWIEWLKNTLIQLDFSLGSNPGHKHRKPTLNPLHHCCFSTTCPNATKKSKKSLKSLTCFHFQKQNSHGKWKIHQRKLWGLTKFADID